MNHEIPCGVSKSVLVTVSFMLFAIASIAQETSTRLYRFQKNGLWGFVNSRKDTIIKARWEKVEAFHKNKALVTHKGKRGMIDLKGDYLIPPVYDKIGEVSREGIVGVVRNDSAGYINIDSGVMISPIQWNSAYPFSGGYAKVGKNNLYGMINTTGVLVCPLEYTEIDDIFDGMIKIEKDGKFGFLDSTRTVAIPVIWPYAKYFQEGFAVVLTKNHNYGFIDKKGRLVIELEKGMIPDDFNGGLSGVVRDGKTGFIDSKGKWIIPIQWEGAFPFYGGHAGVKRNGKWGFIDKSGKVAIDFIFDEVRPYRDGTAEGRTKDRWVKIALQKFPSIHPPEEAPKN
jgi:hypothetical protein